METNIKVEHQQHYDNLPSTSDADTIFTITEIKSESFDANLVNSPGEAKYLELEEMSVDDGNCDEEEETHSDQFIANTIIKEEIMIESEPNMEVLEVSESECKTVPHTTSKNQQNQKFSKRRKKVLKNWQKDTIFELETDALEVIKNERIWTKYTTNKTDKGSKVIYRCRNVKSRGPQCEAGLYLFYSNIHLNFTLFRSVNRHTCDLIKSKRTPKIKVKRIVDSSVSVVSSTDLNTNRIDGNQKILKRRKKIVKNWQKEMLFESEEEAQLSVTNEKTWAKYTTNKTDKGRKVIYRCRNVKSRGQQCEAGVYLLHSHMDSEVTLFRSVNKHTCDSIESKRKRYVRAKSKSTIKTASAEQPTTTNDENQKMLKRRKKVLKNWQKEKTFKSESQALEAIRSEQKWTKYTTNKTDKGNKVIYRCKNVKSKGQQCDAGVYLLYANVDGTVTIFRSGNNHSCHTIESKSKSTLTDEAKGIIKFEYERGVKPKNILGVLMANGYTSSKQIQINNYLAQLRREAHQSITLKDFVAKSEPKTLWTNSTECHPTTVNSDILFRMFS